MDYTIWQIIIIIVSTGMVLLSGLCVVFPQKLVDRMPYLTNSKVARYSDILVRVLLGISLILSSDAATFPLVFSLVGYLSLAAVIAIVLLGNRKIGNIVKYIGDKFPIWSVRLVCVFGVLGFSFLICAV